MDVKRLDPWFGVWFARPMKTGRSWSRTPGFHHRRDRPGPLGPGKLLMVMPQSAHARASPSTMGWQLVAVSPGRIRPGDRMGRAPIKANDLASGCHVMFSVSGAAAPECRGSSGERNDHPETEKGHQPRDRVVVACRDGEHAAGFWRPAQIRSGLISRKMSVGLIISRIWNRPLLTWPSVPTSMPSSVRS